MLALYGSGRQAEALDVYRQTRRLLVDELGIEPSPSLQELEQAILRQDVALPPQVGLVQMQRAIMLVDGDANRLDELIGIAELAKPDEGDPVPVGDDEIPVFWACGVTPQSVITTAKPDFCITHYPGSMLVTDRRNAELAIM